MESNLVNFQNHKQMMILTIQKVGFDFQECLDFFVIYQICRLVQRGSLCYLEKLRFSQPMDSHLLICFSHQSIKGIPLNMLNQEATNYKQVFLIFVCLIQPFQFFTQDRRTLALQVSNPFNWIKFNLVNKQLLLKSKQSKISFLNFLQTMCQAIVWRVMLNL